MEGVERTNAVVVREAEQGAGVKIVNNGLHFYLLFSLHFIFSFSFSFIFRTT